MSERIQYWCRACPEMFTNAETANAHHDATGHHQAFRCPACSRALSAHTDADYDGCIAAGALGSSPQLRRLPLGEKR